jgi:hypothetical protein
LRRTCEYNIRNESCQKIAKEKTVDEGESALGLVGFDDPGSKRMHSFIQGAEAQVGDEGARGEADCGDQAESPADKGREGRAKNEQEAKHPGDGGRKELIRGG